MPEDVYDLLKELCEIPGPVGRETQVQDRMKQYFEEFGLEVTQDKIGNLLSTMNGAGSHYALVAHADEVGFLVHKIDERGFLQAKWNTQGHLPDLRLVPGQRVSIMTDEAVVNGCFCVQTAHIAGKRGKSRIPKFDEVFIDIGVDSTQEAQDLGINIGDPIIYDAKTEKIGCKVMGKSMDDRVGLTIISKIAEEFSKIDKDKRPTLTFVSTVMEELGAKGAAAVASQLDVDGVIVLEIGLADDYPGTSCQAGVSLGKGPVIVIKDSQIHYSYEQNKVLFNTAEDSSISHQRAVYHNYATDGFQIVSQGQNVSTIGVPCRYSHSSFETIHLKDVEDSIQLVYDFLKTS